MRLLKIVVTLVILAVAGLAAYAYLGDLTPAQRETRVPLALGADGISPGRPVTTAPASDATQDIPAAPADLEDTPDEAAPSDADTPAGSGEQSEATGSVNLD